MSSGPAPAPAPLAPAPGRRALVRLLAVAGVIAGVLPGFPPAAALLAGAAFGLGLGNPWPSRTPAWVRNGLAVCVVGLGFGVDLGVVARVGAHGLGATAVGIFASLALGLALARLLGVERVLALLISTGTAICGGSAIAAVAPVLDAKDEDVGIAIGVVFLLNAAALVLFPPLGQLLGMTPPQFGEWAALAIHDTSSVVGAAAAYGGDALAVATPTKLARALWILPVSAALAWHERRAGGARLPWFIPAFLAAAALVWAVPAAAEPGRGVAALARHGLGGVLFLTGLGLTRRTLARVSVRPLVLAVVLWAFVATLGWFTVRLGA